ncbi:Reverse transcriptase domain-containing protein [Mycena indigotica]|uniref:Reverse transcriptase domain-containing protein n=1 Tax=Mycena indigotica TaxID=2126181 RepID=A0A8H6RV79_9AGAR|nr:Reverse transcriptase domain-containing protein [Mycena indigotica]KAF7288455.1 Reverse transcriptase domain-containing protein [Mycena indigotica]
MYSVLWAKQVVWAATHAPSAAQKTTPLSNAGPHNFLPVVTPLVCDEWERALRTVNLYNEFHDILTGINMDLSSSYTPANCRTALEHPNVIDEYIQTELASHRYSGPFNLSRLKAIIGPIRSSPLGVVPKAGEPDKWRMVQDFSFPYDDPEIVSINSTIDSDDFPCDWGTFSQMLLLVLDAPPGTQAATLDVDAAFRRVPIHPSQQWFFVVSWRDLCYIDHCAPFGPSSSPGIFGQIADAMPALLTSNHISPLKKWVDDFCFFRYLQDSGDY